MARDIATKNATEQIVLDFLHAAYGETMDIDAMTALMADDFVWQLHVPLSPVVVGAMRRALSSRSTTRSRQGCSTGVRSAQLCPRVTPSRLSALT